MASVSGRAGTSEHSATACMTRVSVARVVVLVGDLLDLVTPGGRERFLQQLRGSVERDERADLLVAQPVAGIDDQLLGELDDRPVRPAEHRRAAALSASRRNRVDEQLHLVGHERIQANELVLGDVGRPGRRLKPDVGVQLIAMSGEPLADERSVRRRSCRVRAGW